MGPFSASSQPHTKQQVSYRAGNQVEWEGAEAWVFREKSIGSNEEGELKIKKIAPRSGQPAFQLFANSRGKGSWLLKSQ